MWTELLIIAGECFAAWLVWVVVVGWLAMKDFSNGFVCGVLIVVTTAVASTIFIVNAYYIIWP